MSKKKKDEKKKKSGSWKCPNCGKSFGDKCAFKSHCRCCISTRTTSTTDTTEATTSSSSAGRTWTLQPDCLQPDRERLSDFNMLLTECLELVEATIEDVERNHRSNANRRRQAVVGEIGVRCIACARNSNHVQTPGSTRYPQSLHTLPFNIYKLVQDHLLLTCPSISNSLRVRLMETKVSTTSQSMSKGRLGLPVYLKMVTHEYQLTDNHGVNEGIRCNNNSHHQQQRDDNTTRTAAMATTTTTITTTPQPSQSASLPSTIDTTSTTPSSRENSLSPSTGSKHGSTKHGTKRRRRGEQQSFHNKRSGDTHEDCSLPVAPVSGGGQLTNSHHVTSSNTLPSDSIDSRGSHSVSRSGTGTQTHSTVGRGRTRPNLHTTSSSTW